MPTQFSSIVNRIDSIPSTPGIMAKINAILHNEKSSVSDVCRVIEADQAVVTKILRIVNSGYYNFEEPISSLQQAVAILGFDMIKNITLGVSVIDTFRQHKSIGFDRKQLWLHSILTGILAHMMAEESQVHLDKQDFDNLFMMGSMHDFGKVIIECYFPDEFKEILSLARDKKMSFNEAEKKVMGTFTHTKLGSIIAYEWGFPIRFRQVVEFHHNPTVLQGSEFFTVCFIHVADYVSKLVNFGNYWPEVPQQPQPRVLEILQLQREDLERYADALVAQRSKSSSLMETFFG